MVAFLPWLCTLLIAFPLVLTTELPGTLSRLATAADIEANWNLVESSDSTNTSTCPRSITHTTWKALSPSSYGVDHPTILVNRIRCDGSGSKRQLVFYSSSAYFRNLTPMKPETAKLPDRMRQIITTPGANARVFSAIYATGEQFLIGYESTNRFCKGTTYFQNGTVAYLARPFETFTIPNITTKFIPGTKYLIMVPSSSRTTCVYSSALNATIDVPVTISPQSPEPEGDETLEPSDVASAEPAEGETESVEPDEEESLTPDEGQTAPPPVNAGASPTPDGSATIIDDGTGQADGESADDEGESEAGSTEEITPTETESEDDDDVCFPASASVTLLDGSTTRMSQLQVGDEVLVGPNTYSRVFAFSHRDSNVRKLFYTLYTSCGHSISATQGHFIYADDVGMPIELVQVGQSLRTMKGSGVVVKIDRQWMRGLYNPQTVQGDIVVNGVVASTYTRSVVPAVAHAALAPLRAMSTVCRADILGLLLEAGMRQLPGRKWARVA